MSWSRSQILYRRRDADDGTQPLHVLLAEDDPDLRYILAALLRADGHRVTEVADGDRLTDEIINATQDPSRTIDIAVTDVRMPGRSGLEALASVRHFEGCPPFIVMTAFGDDRVRREADRLGVVGLLDKPFSPSALLDLVNEHARRQA
jgi:CheY-like chemotaxis protein